MQHFYFNSGPIADDPAAILEQVEKCFAEMAKHKGDFGYMRLPPRVIREKSFDTGRNMACVQCRISLTDDPRELLSPQP